MTTIYLPHEFPQENINQLCTREHELHLPTDLVFPDQAAVDAACTREHTPADPYDTPYIIPAEWDGPLSWEEAVAGVPFIPEWSVRVNINSIPNRRGWTAAERDAFRAGRNWVSSTSPMNTQARLLIDCPGGALTTPMWVIAGARRWGFPAKKVMRVLLQESTASMSATADCTGRATFPYDPALYHIACASGWNRSEGDFMIGACWYAIGLPGLVRHSTCFNLELYLALLRARVQGWDTAVTAAAGDGGAGYLASVSDPDRMLEGCQIIHFTGPGQWFPVTGSGAQYRQHLAEEEAWQRWLNDQLLPPPSATYVAATRIPLLRPGLSAQEAAHYGAA